MNPRWALAGVMAGMAMFFWSGFSHMVLMLEEKQFKTFPNDAAVLTALKQNVKEPGIYFFPNEMDPEKMQARIAVDPRGIMTYSPPGTPFSMGQSLGIQCLTDIVIGLLMAFFFMKAQLRIGSLGEAMVFTVLMAVMIPVGIVGPYVNWYGFPLGMLAVNVLDAAVCGALAGGIFHKMIR